jgi:A/G-specific adenine glycosylase
MLQQTPVSRVESYYHHFLERYPSIESLAAAPPSSVRESWEGLGYYRRAVSLQRLAQEVVRDRAGVIPGDPAELRRLPGVGRYTAGAVASFAFERATPAVDTNVGRVLRRAFHPRTPQQSLTRRLWNTAEQILPRRGKSAWAFNQAIMELGALICTARVAKCGECPVRAACATGRNKRPADIPCGTARRCPSSMDSGDATVAEHPRSGGPRQTKSPAREGGVGVRPM